MLVFFSPNTRILLQNYCDTHGVWTDSLKNQFWILDLKKNGIRQNELKKTDSGDPLPPSLVNTRSENIAGLEPIVQTKAPKSVNLCRLHNFFPGTPPLPPPCYSFDPGHLIPWPGSSFWAPSAQMSCLLKKCINASLRMCFNQWYQCHSLNSQFMPAEGPNPCHQGVPCIPPPSCTTWSKSGGGGKIQVRKDPQKCSALRSPKIRIFSGVQRHRREIFGIWML